MTQPAQVLAGRREVAVGVAGFSPPRGTEPTCGSPPAGGPAAPGTPTTVPTLAGFTIAVASDLKRHDVATWLEARGARTISVRAVRSVPQPDPDDIAAAILACITAPVHEVIVSSAFGLRAWLAAARRAGQLAALVHGLSQARLLARDPRTADGLRELGLTQIWSTAAGTTEDLFRYLIAQPMAGRRVLAHIESDAHRELCWTLQSHGASVVEIATVQAAPPNTSDVLRRLCDLVVRRQVDAVALIGAAATKHLLEQATRDGTLDDLLNTFVEHVNAVCLGPLTAAPLRQRGVPVVQAAEAIPESLVDATVGEVPRRSVVVDVGGHRIEIRGQAVVLDDQLVPVQAGPLAVLRALAARPGRVLSAAEIRASMPGSSTVDDHAIEMSVSRLRSTVGPGLNGVELVQTVMKRGYRLAV